MRGSDPTDSPIIDPNFLSDPDDLDLLVKAGVVALDMIESDPMKEHVDKFIVPEVWPEDDHALKQHIIKSLETCYHPVGTCKMGNDVMAVVDDQLKVHAIDGLRLIDDSIMPTVVTGNTNAPIYMIAEKGADMIKAS